MKKLLKTLIILCGIIAIIPIVAKADTFSLNARANKTKVEAGETITVTLTANASDVTGGINAVEGYLTYDENVFENVTATGSGWSLSYNSSNGKILGTWNGSPATGDAITIGTITFTAKTTLTVDSTTIKIANIKTSNDDDEINATSNATVNLTVEKTASTVEPGDNTEDQENNTGNNTENNENNGNTGESTEKPTTTTEEKTSAGNGNGSFTTTTVSATTKDKTRSSDKIPQTGSAMPLITTIAIIGLAVSAIRLRSKYNNIDK